MRNFFSVRNLLFLLLFLASSGGGYAQLTVTAGAGMNYTPQQLVENWLVGQGISASNAKFNGSGALISSTQIGTFETEGTATTELGLESGVLLTSGDANLAIGPNNSTGATGQTSFGGDPDLDIIAGTSTLDACVLEFDFVPQSDTLKFRYVFASEEFPEFCGQYNDAFGFFLSGPGISGPFSNNSVNLAKMPETGFPVTINNICDDPSSYWDNPQGGVNFQYDRFTIVLTAWHIVVPCSTYHIKLAIADALDRQLDSGVFLEKNSFNATGLMVNNSFTVPKLGNLAVEGCNNVTVSFLLASPMSIPYTINYTVAGTATRGVDYTDIPDSLVITPGHDSTALVIVPINDGITEGLETVILIIEQPSCQGTNLYYDTIPIIDNPVMYISPQPDLSICTGTTVQLFAVASGGQRPYTYQWNVLPGTDSSLTVTPPIGMNTYTVSVTDLCGTVMYDTILVEVSPIPILTNPLHRFVQCSGAAASIIFSSNVPSATYTWTAVNPGGHITGFFPGSGPAIDQTLVNNSYVKDSVIYTVTPHITGCSGVPSAFTVVVNPVPDLSNSPPAMQICNNGSPNLVLTSNIAGTLFTWTCTPSSGSITGWADNLVPAGILDQTLVNSSLTAQSVVYHMMPTANNCPGPVTDFTVTLIPTPDIIFNPPGQTICSQQSTMIQLQSSVPGTTFSWIVGSSGPDLAGQSPGSGAQIQQIITNSANFAEAVTYQVTPAVTGCPPGAAQNVVVNVNPLPQVTNPILAFQICSSASTNINLQSNVAGATFSWTASGSSSSLTGYTAGSGSLIAQTLVNNGLNPETATYLVTPSANSCSGSIVSFTVTVFPVPNVVLSPSTQVICSGFSAPVSLTSGVSGTSFSWTASGSGPDISGYAPGTGDQISQILNNSGYQTGTVTYFVNPSANGCPGTQGSASVTIRPLPSVTFTICFDPVVTTTSLPIRLTGGIPAGGTYAGPGVAAGQFQPAVAGPGNHTVTYTYNNTYGCSALASVPITVITATPFTCGNSLTDIRDNNTYPTVAIGSQCWMAANLNYGTNIPSTMDQRDNCIVERHCFGDNPANCSASGGLYQWDEAMAYTSAPGSQGICPPEWHVPTEAEWGTLFAVYLNNGFAGNPLKYTGYSGFNAFLSGVRFNDVNWNFSNFAVMFWSSTAHGQKKAWAHGMNIYNPSVSYYPSHRNNSFPLRCLRD